MTPQDLIRKKRDAARFTADEIGLFIGGVCDGSWADYQISALVMAMFVRGLDQNEQNSLVKAMLESGEVLDFSEIDAPVADKHSTGGVGDKTSLIIAPLAAACGVAVPMISGRGLGHTGGTLDKLESIEGYSVRLTAAQIKQTIKKCGFALAGQTKKLVPADRKLYALRDATATIESVPLIVASIMSKKLAEGLDALVLDVKTGSGAFMEKLDDARSLAEALVRTGKDFGVRTEALITDMNQPLGRYIGNALEVYECLKILRGETEPQMRSTLDLSLALTARMLVLTGIAGDLDRAAALCLDKIGSGAALEKFRRNIELQSGNPAICDDPASLLEKNTLRVPVRAEKSGYVGAVDARAVGAAVSEIGGGRVKAEDQIDYAVGFVCEANIGDEIRENDPLGTIVCRTRQQAAAIGPKLSRAFRLDETAPVRPELIREAII